MGCAKNTVDSERLAAQLRLNSIDVVPEARKADIAIINTCGFIDAAKQESIDAIVAQVQLKGKGRLKKVYAMGCLTERYRVDLSKEIPEVDRYFGSNDLADILAELGGDLKRDLLGERVLSTPAHSAYIKISEGCDNPCSFCAIPIMRGKHVSREFGSLIDEARGLVDGGVRELVVIGQDTTYYGLDTDGRRRLSDLLIAFADIPGVSWVRLMYAYPAHFPLDVLDVIASHPRICKYIDIPIQHASDAVLKSMRRGITARALRELLDTIRSRVPGIAVRSTLIAGYPAEGPAEFDELLKFVEEQKFHRLGVFPYSLEDGTTAYPLGDTVPPEEKARRVSAVMELQREISRERNESLIGSEIDVMVERFEDGKVIGRTQYDAPEIDNEAYIDASDAVPPGTICRVRVNDATEYDVYGTLVP
jgi:ribosomal protein S12 methylthiotransferase